MEPEEEPSSQAFELPSSLLETDPTDPGAYLSPFPALTWRKDFRTLDVRGQSLCLIEEIRLHLEFLATWGLPPFPLLSLVLASLHTLGADLLKFDEAWNVALKEGFARRRDEVVRELLRIHGLARPMFVDPQRRVRVVQAVLRLIFEGAYEETPEFARKMLARWSVQEPPRFSLQFSSSARAEQYARFGGEFLRGLARVTPERLELELDPEAHVRTVLLDEPPEPPPLPPPPPTSLLASRLLRELAAEEEWLPATRAAARLTGVLRMPRPVFRPDDAAGGGPADLSRQGELPQLLLSELAFDDDLLAVRIVRREALYRKQEIPPGAPARERILLIDQGLRSWGLPRLRLLGAALAVAAGAPHDLHLRAFNLHAPGWTEIDWSAAKAFAATAGATGSLLHPGEVLAGGLLDSIAPLPWEGDVVLLTHEETAADPEFRARLRPWLGKYRFRRITVDRAGVIRWSEHQAGGWKAGGSCRLTAVDRLAAATERKPDRHAPPADGKDWPAILRLSRFPLRIPESAPPKAALTLTRFGRFEISRQRRLLWWDDPDHGPREILRDLPRGAARFLGVMGTAARPIVTGAIHGHQDGRLHVFRFCPTESRTERFSYVLPHPSLKEVRASRDVLYVTGERRLDLFRFGGSEPRLGEWRFRAGYRMVGGPFVYRIEDGSLFEVAFEGGRTALTRLDRMPPHTSAGLLGIHHAAGDAKEAVVMVLRHEGVRFAGAADVLRNPFTDGPIEQALLSADRLRLRLIQGLLHADADLAARTIGPPVRSVTGGELDPAPFLLRRKNHVFGTAALGLRPDGSVLLVRGGVVWRVDPDTLRLERTPALPPEIPYREPFRAIGSARETWGESKAAGVEFPDGSRILEDPLGAFHFRSSDPHFSEAVLVAFEPQAALWLCRLTDAGLPYAYDPGTTLDPRSAGIFLRAFARRALRD